MLIISQQGLTIVSLQAGVKGRKLSYEEFIAIKKFEGKKRSVRDSLNNGNTGTLVTLTANTGKDMYIAKAKVSMETSTGTTQLADIQLRINGVTVEIYSTRVGDNKVPFYEFVNIGDFVLAGQTIELNVTGSDSGVDIEGTLVCYEEDTGDSPQIPSI